MVENHQPRKLALYANVGSEFTHYDVDVEGGALIKRDTITVPSSVQYAWPHTSRQYLYVASSNRREPQLKQNYVTTYRIDPATGALTKHGDSIQLPARPIHLTTDAPSQNVLVAFNSPSSLHIYRINEDFTAGEEVKQPKKIDGGSYAHQIRVTPDNRHAILSTKGHTAENPEEPGALKMFDYDRGMLTKEESIAPNGGKGFSPRHLDFHPSKPWVYSSIEAQSQLYMYRLENGRLQPDFSYRKDTLAEPRNVKPRQLAGTVHVHPNGRFVYIANRADGTVDFNGTAVFRGGENSIAVYSIDQSTGEPTLIQNTDTRKIHPRTFHIDPSGRLMVVQHNWARNIREGDKVRVEPAGLTLFRIGDDGKLSFVRGYDIDVGDLSMWWMGMVSL